MAPESSDAARGPLSIYTRIARPDHWIKNVLMLPGAAVAALLTHHNVLERLPVVALGFAALCLAASANYTINEYLDAASDRWHPSKRDRPGARGLLDPRIVGLQYAVLAAAALALGWQIGPNFCMVQLALLAMGVLYNVPPFRTKDRVYADVLSESVNNPLRLLLGWYTIVPAGLPPSSILLAYWMGGAFLMAVKRYAEFRGIGDAGVAAAYRRSFRHYTESALLLSCFFYSNCSAFFLAIFLIKYRIEFLLTFPLFSVLFTWYLAIGLRRNSAAEAPERLYRERAFLGFVLLLAAVTALLFVVDLPFIRFLVEPLAYE